MKKKGTLLMEGRQATQISFLWILLVIGALGADFHIENLDCYTDYDTEMTCFWDVINYIGNCSNDFLLKYDSRLVKTQTCVPISMPAGDSSLRNTCICYIHFSSDYVNALAKYDVRVESKGKSLRNTTIQLSLKVKPKTPGNVTVDLSETDNVKLHWDSMYSQRNYLEKYLEFEVYITNKQNPKENKEEKADENKEEKTEENKEEKAEENKEEKADENKEERLMRRLKEDRGCQFKSFLLWEPHYLLSKETLGRGYDYSVKVRSIPKKDHYGGTWSEWSPAAEWYNDYRVSATEQAKIFIPVSGVLLLLFILFCYFSITICKKKWGDTIPDPAKSRLALNNIHKSQGPVLKPAVNSKMLPLATKEERAKITCVNWLNKLIFKAHYVTDQFSQVSGSRNLSGSEDLQQGVLIPENEVIERHFEMCPLENYLKNEINEMQEEEEAADEEEVGEIAGDERELFDWPINQMFNEILGENLVKFEEPVNLMDRSQNSKRANGFPNLDGFSFLAEIGQKEEENMDSFDDSPESGYHSYKCDSSPTKLDSPTTFHFDQWSGDQQESTFHTSTEHSAKNCTEPVCQTITYIDSGYNSFANAVSSSEDSTPSANIVTGKDTELLLGFEEFPVTSAVCNTNIHLETDTNDILYYNKNLSSPFPDNNPDNTDLLSGQLTFCNSNDDSHKQVAQCDAAETFSICEVSEYQSFAEAVQKDTFLNEPLGFSDCPVLETGYKSFDSLLNQNRDETDMEIQLDTDLKETDIFNSMGDTGDMTFEDAQRKDLSFSFPNFQLTESFIKNDYKCARMEKSPPSSSTSTFYENIDSDMKNNTKITLQDENNGVIRYSVDICEHLRNLYGPTVSCKEKLKISALSKIDGIAEDSHSCSLVNNKSNLSEAGFTSVQDHFSLITLMNAPNKQPLKFENVSYFLNPSNLNTLLSDTHSDSDKTTSHLLDQEKIPDKDDNLYMKVSLS